MAALRVGLVGAGPWAWRAHAPALVAGPHTVLAGVWARRPEAAGELAARFRTTAHATFDDLVAASEAVAFAVPPTVQAELAPVAARAGRALLLEKPLAADLDQARAVAGAVGDAGVPSQMVLVLRYAAPVRAFLARAAALSPFGAMAAWVSGVPRGGPSDSPWRREGGALLDVGPHVIDLLDSALGRVLGVRAHRSAPGWTGLLLDHEGGAVSEASLCLSAAREERLVRFEVYGRGGAAVLEGPAVDAATWTTLLAEFADTVRRGGGHPLDAAHGLRLQEVVEAAARQLG